MVRLARFERATTCLEGRCSIQLSYRRNLAETSFRFRWAQVSVGALKCAEISFCLDRRCPSDPGRMTPMKLNMRRLSLGFRAPRVVAKFGLARLVETRHGAVEVRGGTADELVAAKEWISLFMHEATLRGSRG